jgi:hypothetical protein
MANSLTAQLIDGVPTTWYPVDHGLITWAFDPAHATNTYTLATAGTLYTVDLKVGTGTTISNIVYDVTTAGGTLTASQCFVGIYQGGALLGTSASQHTAWGSTGVKTTALAAAAAVAEGIVTVAFFFNGTTGPTLASGSGVALNNAGIAATASRFATAATGNTTALPAALGTKAALVQSPWVALS